MHNECKITMYYCYVATINYVSFWFDKGPTSLLGGVTGPIHFPFYSVLMDFLTSSRLLFISSNNRHSLNYLTCSVTFCTCKMPVFFSPGEWTGYNIHSQVLAIPSLHLFRRDEVMPSNIDFVDFYM